MSNVTTAAEYVRMAEDSLENSDDADYPTDLRQLWATQALVYATLAHVTDGVEQKDAEEIAEHYARLEAMEYRDE